MATQDQGLAGIAVIQGKLVQADSQVTAGFQGKTVQAGLAVFQVRMAHQASAVTQASQGRALADSQASAAIQVLGQADFQGLAVTAG